MCGLGGNAFHLSDQMVCLLRDRMPWQCVMHLEVRVSLRRVIVRNSNEAGVVEHYDVEQHSHFVWLIVCKSRCEDWKILFHYRSPHVCAASEIDAELVLKSPLIDGVLLAIPICA